MMMTVNFTVAAMDDAAKQAVAQIRQQFGSIPGLPLSHGNVGFTGPLYFRTAHHQPYNTGYHYTSNHSFTDYLPLADCGSSAVVIYRV